MKLLNKDWLHELCEWCNLKCQEFTLTNSAAPTQQQTVKKYIICYWITSKYRKAFQHLQPHEFLPEQLVDNVLITVHGLSWFSLNFCLPCYSHFVIIVFGFHRCLEVPATYNYNIYQHMWQKRKTKKAIILINSKKKLTAYMFWAYLWLQ